MVQAPYSSTILDTCLWTRWSW